MVIPGNILPKKDNEDGSRLVLNTSWPVTNYYTDVVRELSEEWVQTVPNDHVKYPDGAGFDWAYIEANNELF